MPLNVLLAATTWRGIAVTREAAGLRKPASPAKERPGRMHSWPRPRLTPGSQSGSRPSVPGLDAAAGRSAANAKGFPSGVGWSRRNSAALVPTPGRRGRIRGKA